MRHREDSFEDFIRGVKALEEYVKSKEKKPEEKKKDDPLKWTFADHLTFIIAFMWSSAFIGTCAILHFATEYQKVLH